MRTIALVLVASILPMVPAAAPPRTCPDLTTVTLNGMPCPPEGTATSEGGKKLNQLKGRCSTPTDDDLDPEVSLAAMLAPGNDVGRFNTKKAATIRGFVVRAMPGGHGESCNCNATAEDEIDTHIELALAPNVPPTQRVIVEVSPRLRMIKGPDWKTPKLRETFQGKFVEVTGWLLFDTAHIAQAENTHPGNPGNFRATAWELHPITSIKPADPGTDEAAGLQPLNLGALQRLHASHLNRSPKGKESLKKLHELTLANFSDKERKEFEEEAAERIKK